jgi:hypothetical protein
MRKFKLLLFVSTLLAMVGCSTIDVTYIGETLKPTREAQIFFERRNIHEPYEVIGKVIARASDTFTGKEIQKKIIKTAEKKGADAVLITLYTQIPGGSSDFSNDPYGYGYGDGFGDDGFAYGGGGYGYDPYLGNEEWGGGGSVEFYYQVLIKAEFLRYKTSNK